MFFSLEREPLPQLRSGCADAPPRPGPGCQPSGRRLPSPPPPKKKKKKKKKKKNRGGGRSPRFLRRHRFDSGRWDRPGITRMSRPRADRSDPTTAASRLHAHGRGRARRARDWTSMCASAGIKPPASAWSRRRRMHAGRHGRMAWRRGSRPSRRGSRVLGPPGRNRRRCVKSRPCTCAIGAARRCIYIENQYLTVVPIADTLAARLVELDGPRWSSSVPSGAKVSSRPP